MAVAELFADYVTTTVSSGGTTAPAALTPETWTVASSTGWPSAATGTSQFRFVDAADTNAPPEIFSCTNVSGTTWAVTRGYEGAVPWAHPAGFTIVPCLTSGSLAAITGAPGVEGAFTADQQIFSGTGNGTGEIIDLLAALKEYFASKGQVLIGTGSGTGGLHSAGNDGEVLLFDSTTTDGFANATFNPAKAYNSLLGASFVDPAMANSSVVLPAAATRFVCKIPLYRQLSITNLLASIQTAATSTLTNCFLGLWSSAGTFLGQSADQSSVWQSGGSQTTGTYTLAISGGPITVTPAQANDWVWVGIYIGAAGGTLPAFSRAPNLTVALNNVGTSAAAGNVRFGSQALASTATLTSITPTSLALTANSFFVAIS